MKLRKITQNPLLMIGILLIIGLFMSCEDDDGPVAPGDGVSRVNGRVTDQSGFQKRSVTNPDSTIEGATVTLLKIQADGSAQVVSSDSVVTDSMGEFVLETGLNGVSNLVVQAEKNNESWKAAVSAAVQHDATVMVQPLNSETTVEADVYSRVVAHDDADLVSYVDVAMQTDSSTALEIQGNSTAINDFAVAIAEMVDARKAILLDTAVAATQAQITASNSLRVQAQEDLEADLFTGAGSPFGNFYEAEMEAYTSNEIDASGCVKAKETAGMVLIKNSNSLNSDTRFAIAKNNAQIRALALMMATQNEFGVLDAPGSKLTTVRNAGFVLINSIGTSSNFVDILVAFDDYHDTILTELTDLLSAHASQISSIDGSINVTAGLKSILKTAVDASASTQGVVNAYMAFYHDVTVLAKATLTALGTADIEAVTNVLILTNVQLSL